MLETAADMAEQASTVAAEGTACTKLLVRKARTSVAVENILFEWRLKMRVLLRNMRDYHDHWFYRRL